MNSQQIQQLVDQKTLPDQPHSVKLVETHISWVLITPTHAYKIKKPLTFSFLDFSTLDKRRHFCREEFELNSRLAPDMYLGVLPVREKDGQPFIGKQEGTIIDYAVHMKRMDDSRQMDKLLRQGKVNKEDLTKIADQLALFHQQTKKAEGKEDVSEIHNKFADIESVAAFMGRHFEEEAERFIKALVRFSKTFTDQHQKRFEERFREGFVVDGHGDLHSRNIFLLEEPVIFDCIEFSEEFRTLDVLSDIGFFCMDLDYYGRSDLGRHFLSAYLARNACMPQKEDQQIFHYYKMYRANVRLKVNALAGIQQEEGEGVTEDLKEEIGVYYRLLKDYLIQVAKQL